MWSDLRTVASPDFIDVAWALGTYRGPLGDLLRRAKYRRDLGLADTIGIWLAEASDALPLVDAVIPVQAPWWRTLRRGQDIPPRLARSVAKTMGVPVLHTLRQRGSHAQVGKGRADRLASDGERFLVTRPAPCRVLLVDDVRTTGATLCSCAAVLREAGACWVGALTAVVRRWDDVKKS